MRDYIWMFVAAFMLDIIWARYTIALADRRALQAGGWSMLIFLVGGGLSVAYVHNPRLLIPAALGAFAGTYYAVKTDK